MLLLRTISMNHFTEKYESTIYVNACKIYSILQILAICHSIEIFCTITDNIKHNKIINNVFNNF